MIHELLLALNGCHGDIFAYNRDTGMIEVVDELPFIHPSEVQLLNKICRLGTYYQRLHTFVEQQQTAENGLYIKALASGVDEILSAYRQTLLRIEEEAYSDPHMPLTHVREQLDEYQSVLPRVDHIVHIIIRQKKWKGGEILTHVYEQCNSGDPLLKQTFQRLLHICHKVMYQQSSAWMLHGLLLDHHKEFFVEAIPPSTEPSLSDDGSPHRGSPGISDGVVEASGSPLSSYRLRSPMLPLYLPVRVAEKMLFIGEAAQIFHSTDKTVMNASKRGNEQMLLARQDELRLASLLAELQQFPVFNVQQFETAIDSIRTCVAERLWKLVVEDSNLIGHLHTLKDFFLLGRGELFQTFVEMVQALLREPVTATTEHDVNAAFKQAIYKVGMDEEMTQCFTLKCPVSVTTAQRKASSTSGGGNKLENGWSRLGLSYHVRWPLHTIFTTTILQQYNTLFGLLINVRQAQVTLQHCWAQQMTHKGCSELGLTLVRQLRSHMAFFIDNIQYYFQVDVIESQFSLLLESIRSTHDFESIQQAHCNFISSIFRQLFLQMPSVLHLLNELLQLCTSFGLLCAAGLRTNATPELDRLSRDFHRKSSQFLRQLSDIRDHQDSPHLSQLLLCVDYNRYFETSRSLPSHLAETKN